MSTTADVLHPTREQVIEAMVECMGCSMSGHWPVLEPDSRTFAESLSDDQVRAWLGFRCCGFRQRGISGFVTARNSLRRAAGDNRSAMSKVNTDPACSRCGGEGWVCEDHPNVAWCDGTGCCGGAGASCACVPEGAWPVAPGDTYFDLASGRPIASFEPVAEPEHMGRHQRYRGGA